MTARKVVFCLALVEILNGQNVGSVGLNVTTTLRALSPKGFRAYIYGDVDTNVLIFDGVLYGFLERGKKQFWGIAVKQPYGGWLFEDPNLTLNGGRTVGSRISYRIFLPDQLTPLIQEGDKVSYKLKGVETDPMEFQVSELEDPSAPEPSCLPTATKVRGQKHVCAGDVLFEDNFDTLQEDVWQIEQYIPFDHPDHPFVSYQRLTSDPNVFVENGTLHIVPKLQQNLLKGQESILSGLLDLNDGCTRSLCSKQAFGADILPPIVSGRLTSYSFSFTYGTVYVRAKVPKGDWLYPDEIKLTVDGDKYFYWKRPSLCENITSAFNYLHLTLGVAAGGDTVFPDNSTNGNSREKSWRNGDPKASLHFWEALHSWLPTWTQPSLIIDYVKVVAL